MVLVEHAFGVPQVEVVDSRDVPRQIGQPFEVGAHHGVFGAGGRDVFQPLELPIRFLPGFIR